MGTRAEREKLKALYGPSWASRVERMPDAQVIAIFRKFQQEGKIK